MKGFVEAEGLLITHCPSISSLFALVFIECSCLSQVLLFLSSYTTPNVGSGPSLATPEWCCHSNGQWRSNYHSPLQALRFCKQKLQFDRIFPSDLKGTLRLGGVGFLRKPMLNTANKNIHKYTIYIPRAWIYPLFTYSWGPVWEYM